MRVQNWGNENAQFSDLLLELGNGVYLQEQGRVILHEDLCCTVCEMPDFISSVSIWKIRGFVKDPF